LKADPAYQSNNDRVKQRARLLPELRSRLAHYSAVQLSDIFEKHGLPYAPINRPQDLVDDPHLLASGSLAPIMLPDGSQVNTVLFPFTMDGQRLGIRHNPPALGADSAEILKSLGYSAIDAARLGSIQANKDK
jgi:crotonobetainyl-CoA:carnitine CoA-transferase CaiB-like acyl-CoA transferase